MLGQKKKIVTSLASGPILASACRHLHIGALIGWLHKDHFSPLLSHWDGLSKASDGAADSSANNPPWLPGGSGFFSALRALNPLGVVTRVCLPHCKNVRMPHHPFQRRAGNNEQEGVDGPRAVMIKCEVFLFALNNGSSYCTKGLVVTLKIIGYDSCDSVPVRTKLSNLKPEHSGYESELFISLKKFEEKEGGETFGFINYSQVHENQ